MVMGLIKAVSQWLNSKIGCSNVRRYYNNTPLLLVIKEEHYNTSKNFDSTETAYTILRHHHNVEHPHTQNLS